MIKLIALQADEVRVVRQYLLPQKLAMLPSHLKCEIALEGDPAEAQYRHTPAIDETYFRRHPIPETQMECLRCAAGRKLSSEIRPQHDRDLRLLLGHLTTLDGASDELDRRRRRTENARTVSKVAPSPGQKFISGVENKDFAEEQTVRPQEAGRYECDCSYLHVSDAQQTEDACRYSDNSSDSDTSDDEEEGKVVDEEDDFEHRLQPMPSHDPNFQVEEAEYCSNEPSISQCSHDDWQRTISPPVSGDEMADGEWNT